MSRVTSVMCHECDVSHVSHHGGVVQLEVPHAVAVTRECLDAAPVTLPPHLTSICSVVFQVLVVLTRAMKAYTTMHNTTNKSAHFEGRVVAAGEDDAVVEVHALDALVVALLLPRLGQVLQVPHLD